MPVTGPRDASRQVSALSSGTPRPDVDPQHPFPLPGSVTGTWQCSCLSFCSSLLILPLPLLLPLVLSLVNAQAGAQGGQVNCSQGVEMGPFGHQIWPQVWEQEGQNREQLAVSKTTMLMKVLASDQMMGTNAPPRVGEGSPLV